MHIIAFILVGLIAGFVASKIVTGHGMGTLGDIVVGIIGALIAGLVFNPNGATYGNGFWTSVLWAILGAVVLLFIVKLAYRALGGTPTAPRV